MSGNPVVPDREMVVDYATGERFLRLHLDIALDDQLFDRVRELLDSKSDGEALAALITALPDHHEPYLELFFNPPNKARLTDKN